MESVLLEDNPHWTNAEAYDHFVRREALEQAGGLFLIEPSKEKLVIRGRFEQPDRRSPPAWAHPVIANGKLYIRDQDLLLCYDVTAK